MFFPKEGMKTVWRSKEEILLPYSDDPTSAMLLSRVAPNQVDASLACSSYHCPLVASIQSDHNTRACQRILGSCP